MNSTAPKNKQDRGNNVSLKGAQTKQNQISSDSFPGQNPKGPQAVRRLGLMVFRIGAARALRGSRGIRKGFVKSSGLAMSEDLRRGSKW